MIYPRLNRVRNDQRLSVELVNGLIKRTEYAGDLLRQGKCLAGTDISVAQRYDGTTISGGGGRGGRFNIVGIYNDIQNKRRGFLYDGTNFTDIFVSGRNETFPTGISGSLIVGHSTNNFGSQLPFVFDGSSYFGISVPGKDLREARSIDGDNIVGRYRQSGTDRGYLYNYTTSSFTDIFVPGTLSTTADAIEGNIIAGGAVTASATLGFIFDGSSYQTFAYPGASFTFVRGISGSNILGIAGFPSPQPSVYFVYDGSGFTNISVPRQGNIRNIKDTNYVGNLEDGSGEGFLYDGTNLETFSFPGSAFTSAFDLD